MVSSSVDYVLSLTTPRLSSRKKRGVSTLESEVTESSEFYTDSDEILRWSSLSEGEYQRFVSVEDGVKLSCRGLTSVVR